MAEKKIVKPKKVSKPKVTPKESKKEIKKKVPAKSGSVSGGKASELEPVLKVQTAEDAVPVVEIGIESEEKGGSHKTYLYAVGRRKESVAQVRLIKNGNGKVTVNGRELANYFGSPLLQEIVTAALKVVGQDDKLDISAQVSGGGLTGQAEAIRMGVSRALLLLNSVFRKSLRRHGYLTRDSRMKERKKPGLKRARRAPQWQKR